MTAWVTGAAGSVGSELMRRISGVIGSDLEVDVTDRDAVMHYARANRPDVIFHCAGAKHAPEGETDPKHVSDVNIYGTANVLEAAEAIGARVVVASTCKAADPETAYGASKLIAERMTLNAGQRVARFYNVRETQGNVFEIWRNTPAQEPLRVMPCWRYFISLEQAGYLMLAAASLPSGRYSVFPGEPVYIPDLALEMYPARVIKLVAPRRGDRLREPFTAACETAVDIGGGLMRVSGVHDPGGGDADPPSVSYDLGAGTTARVVSEVA